MFKYIERNEKTKKVSERCHSNDESNIDNKKKRDKSYNTNGTLATHAARL